MSTPTMNENDHQIAPLRAALHHRAATADASTVEFGAVLSRAERVKRRNDRNRKIGALTTSLIVVLGVVGVVKIKGHRPQKVAASAELRLIPDYLPGADARLTMSPDYDPPLEDAGWIAGWRSSDTQYVSVQTMLAPDGFGAPGLDDVIARGEPSSLPADNKNQQPVFMSWQHKTDQKNWMVNLIMPPGTPWADQIKIARSLSIKPATGEISASQPPLGLPRVGAFAAADQRPLGRWILNASGVTIDAVLPNPKAHDDGWLGRNPKTSKVRLRGTQGESVRYDDPRLQGIGASTVSWMEEGWNVSVSLSGQPVPSLAEVLKVAESLRPATDAEWAALKDGSGIEKPRPPAPGVTDVLAGDGEINGTKWSLSFANAVTAEGCLNITVELGSTVQKCVPINEQPILWSQVRNVGSTEVLVALLSTAVDTATVNGAQEEGHEFVPEGQTVFNGSSTTYVEWLVVPLKQGADVSIEAFRNLPVPEGANDVDGPAADIPGESIGTFPVTR